ncbi:atherin-like isoform X2 [Myiozetetes cayanensis]|uniref:atherin-like isoform X2 n=1 Tax=Myiozetetes cayanensis TaxID=478635 RepID=UPI00215EB4C3|nr:atherin-like isoform X2 [Myiozetetes cayanensis]
MGLFQLRILSESKILTNRSLRNTGKQFANAKPREAPPCDASLRRAAPRRPGPLRPAPSALCSSPSAPLRSTPLPPLRSSPAAPGRAGPLGIAPVLSRCSRSSEHAAHVRELVKQNQLLFPPSPQPRFIQN